MSSRRTFDRNAGPDPAAKRILDMWVAVVGLTLSAPLLLVVSASIRLTMGAPVLFRQLRPGYRGIPFTLLKFRTMNESRSESGQLLPDEERLTRLGRFLRRTSLDELPQLWNVLKGDLSMVGPRPLLMQYLERYTPFQMRRHEAKPGITGWAQIKGRNAISWEEKFALDVWYVDNRSLMLDLRILLVTVLKVVTGHGISQEGKSTMDEFMGTPDV